MGACGSKKSKPAHQGQVEKDDGVHEPVHNTPNQSKHANKEAGKPREHPQPTHKKAGDAVPQKNMDGIEDAGEDGVPIMPHNEQIKGTQNTKNEPVNLKK